MKAMKTLLATGIAAASLASPAMAELSASAGVASQYLFRGIDQGLGDAQVFGDITYSNSGFYASAWISSTGSIGEEVDFLAGWNGEFGGLGVDIGAVNYYYSQDNAFSGVDVDNFGGLSEAYLGLSFAGVEFYYYDMIADGGLTLGDNNYYSLSYGMGPFSALVGYNDLDEADGQSFDNDYVHLDLTYAFNDNLSFTVSKIVDTDDENNVNKSSTFTGTGFPVDDDTQFVVSYSLPIK